MEIESEPIDLSELPDTVPQQRESQFPRLHEHALAWLRGVFESSFNTPTADLAMQCLGIASTLPPDEPMACFTRNVSMTTTLALEFLGSHWMRDEHVNAGFDYLAQQLGPDARTTFMLCWHLDVLHGFRHGDGSRDANRPYNPSLPRYGDEPICSGQVDRVVVPAFIHGNHWTVFIIDLRAHTIAFADPMFTAAPPPAGMLSDLRWWLSGLVPGRSFAVAPNPFGSQVQTDSSSCGIVILSNTAHLLFGHPPWTQATWHDHRMLWFCRLAEFWLEDSFVSLMDAMTM